MARVALISTVETKIAEVAFFKAALESHGLTVEIVDTSLRSNGTVWDGAQKIAAMERVTQAAAAKVFDLISDDVGVVIGLGGGTGGEIILRLMQSMPYDFPKVLVTTLPFDPRYVLADNSIILVPTLADICGLNTSLRAVLNNAAAIAFGLAKACTAPVAKTKSIGITALGATQGCADAVACDLIGMGEEATLFHANGFGGAAYTRFIETGAFKAVVDLTCHELTRMKVAGVHVNMPRRFTAAGTASLPQIVLPGGLNFIGLGELSLVPPAYLDRPHYQHTGLFTHVKMDGEEMTRIAEILAGHLNAATGPVHLILPMGGFSHRDCPGGAIEDAGLRRIFSDTIRAHLHDDIRITTLDTHINHHDTAACVIDTLRRYL